MSDFAGGLQTRFRLLVWLALAEAALVVLYLAAGGASGGLISSLALVGVTAIAFLGIPVLGWHFRIPYAARVLFPIFSFLNVNPDGKDPRSILWALAALPVIMFFSGWVIDWTLARRDEKPGIRRRVGFTFLWVLLLLGVFGLSEHEWNDLLGALVFVLGGAAVWWRLPERWEGSLDQVAQGERLALGFRKGGAWLASRVAIVALILCPAVVFLDLLDLPDHLRKQLGDPPDSLMLYSLRDGQAFDLLELEKLEVYAGAKDSTRAVLDALQKLRAAPRDPAVLEALRKLGEKRITSDIEFVNAFGSSPIFYVEENLAGTDRGTGGILFTSDLRDVKRSELRSVTTEDIEHHEIEIRRATIVLMANAVLVLLLLGGNSGRSAAAWWLALYLVGTNVGWTSGALDLVVERVRFVMWRNYGDEAYGVLLLGAHGLLLYVLRLLEWLVSHQIVQAGLWVALCWPSRSGRLIHTAWDRFWYQLPKIVLVAGLLLLLRSGGTVMDPEGGRGMLAWLTVLPLVLIGAGFWMRRRSGRNRILPRVGRLAVVALLLRGWVPVLTWYEFNWGMQGSWIGILAVVMVVTASVLLVLSLERGTFLVPPHVEGQIWLIGVATLPFLESIVGEPMSAWIEGTGLFTGSAVSWVAFGAAVWLISPVAGFVGDRLARLWARGLDTIKTAQAELIASVPRPANEAGARGPLVVARQLIDHMGVCDAVAWRVGQDGRFYVWHARVEPGETFALSDRLAGKLATGGRALRLEEMRDSWEWAGEAEELELLFENLGDIFLIPLPFEGTLLGVLTAPDCGTNRFLLRPVVSEGLGRVLATALVMSRPELIQESRVTQDCIAVS